DDSGVATSVDEFFLDSIDLPFEEIESPHPLPTVEPIEFVSNEVCHSEVGREAISKRPSGAIQERENIAKDIKFIIDALKSESCETEEVKARILHLKGQSLGGFRVLVSILQTHYPDFLNMELPNINISSKDFMIPDLAVNDSSPMNFFKSENTQSPDPNPNSSNDQMATSSYSEADSPNWSIDSPSKPKSPPDESRKARYERTASILSRSGLLDITMKTAELIQKNTKLNKELQRLREETNQFVQNVLENPANQSLLTPRSSMSRSVPGKSTQVFLSPNLDFHIFSSMGQFQTLTPVAKGAHSEAIQFIIFDIIMRFVSVIISILCLAHPSELCTSARGKLPTNDNEVHEVFPTLYQFDMKSKLLNASKDEMCPRSKKMKSCQLVNVQFQALKSMKLKVPLRRDDPNAFLVLKKVSEEGLNMALINPNQPLTATISYKVGTELASFVLKQSKLYGSIRISPSGHKLFIEPCPDPYLCHIVVEK
ncbi:hypothetical protein TCAL_06790, partial [Tigriopus californicus]